MICFPTSKINLGLSVKGRRADGYHHIESVFYPIPLYDVLEFRKAEQLRLQLHGLPVEGEAGDNLVSRAFKLFEEKFKIPPLEIILLKNIPAGSGLGGGSSDAAFFIGALNDYFRTDLSKSELNMMALELGSDCPFFIANQPALVEGRGEKLTPSNLSLKGFDFVLVFTDIHVSTKFAFSGIVQGNRKKSPFEIIEQPPETWKEELFNDFEEPVFRWYPKLKTIKTSLYQSGAVYASMTGSGSAIYGLFRETPQLDNFLTKYKIWTHTF